MAERMPPTPADLFRAAEHAERSGQLGEAERLYRAAGFSDEASRVEEQGSEAAATTGG